MKKGYLLPKTRLSFLLLRVEVGELHRSDIPVLEQVQILGILPGVEEEVRVDLSRGLREEVDHSVGGVPRVVDRKAAISPETLAQDLFSPGEPDRGDPGRLVREVFVPRLYPVSPGGGAAELGCRPAPDEAEKVREDGVAAMSRHGAEGGRHSGSQEYE